jgi:hypothetical protein
LSRDFGIKTSLRPRDPFDKSTSITVEARKRPELGAVLGLTFAPRPHKQAA